jgi:excisionase family DNA binding protein
MDYITARQAGKILGISSRRVTALIEAGRLPAFKLSNIWVIKNKDLKKVKDRKPGRPRKK